MEIIMKIEKREDCGYNIYPYSLKVTVTDKGEYPTSYIFEWEDKTLLQLPVKSIMVGSSEIDNININMFGDEYTTDNIEVLCISYEEARDIYKLLLSRIFYSCKEWCCWIHISKNTCYYITQEGFRIVNN